MYKFFLLYASGWFISIMLQKLLLYFHSVVSNVTTFTISGTSFSTVLFSLINRLQCLTPPFEEGRTDGTKSGGVVKVVGMHDSYQTNKLPADNYIIFNQPDNSIYSK